MKIYLGKKKKIKIRVNDWIKVEHSIRPLKVMELISPWYRCCWAGSSLNCNIHIAEIERVLTLNEACILHEEFKRRN